MAYVEWHDTVRNHPKTDALMLALDLERYQAVGIIGCLSSWAIQFRPGGIIERRYVAVAIEWRGDADRLLKALISAGWLDEKNEDQVAIHDWKDITRGYRKARKDAARKRRERRGKDCGTSTDNPRTVHGAAHEIPPTPPRSELNEQNRTEQSRAESSPRDEVVRQLLRTAKHADIPNNPDSLRRHIKAWINRTSAHEVERVLMLPEVRGANVLQIDKTYFNGDGKVKKPMSAALKKYYAEEEAQRAAKENQA